MVSLAEPTYMSFLQGRTKSYYSPFQITHTFGAKQKLDFPPPKKTPRSPRCDTTLPPSEKKNPSCKMHLNPQFFQNQKSKPGTPHITTTSVQPPWFRTGRTESNRFPLPVQGAKIQRYLSNLPISPSLPPPKKHPSPPHPLLNHLFPNPQVFLEKTHTPPAPPEEFFSLNFVKGIEGAKRKEKILFLLL